VAGRKQLSDNYITGCTRNSNFPRQLTISWSIYQLVGCYVRLVAFKHVLGADGFGHGLRSTDWQKTYRRQWL